MRLDPNVSNILDELLYNIKELKATLRNVKVKEKVKKCKPKKKRKKIAKKNVETL